MVIDPGHQLRILMFGKVSFMTNRVSKSQFKARALEFFREIEASGEPMIITDHGEPKLEVRPYSRPKRDPREFLRGTVIRYEDPFEPVGLEDWEALK
ncbi:type II toxin-antitoxin system Phd/YefM family antitoxin [Pseudaminobacter soli (ex Zhang et al. 2022)]|nr:type II toxin-antitoxin system Phd/YefM family antitoxin [Pseudaminobacter soli]